MSTEPLYTTQECARLLGVPPGRISMAIYDGRLPPPRRVGRAYLWGPEDLARAARALRIRFVRRADGGPLTGVAAAPAETPQPAVKE